MNELLNQIEMSCDSGQLYLALFSTLTLPDICGAISSDNGFSTGRQYKIWFDEYVAPKYDGMFNGSNCYAFRCAALHQGKAEHKDLGYCRIIFLAPLENRTCIMHKNVLNNALNLDLVTFCKDVVAGVRYWMKEQSDCANFQNNMASFLKRHEGGLLPYVNGADVYC
ncbi:hypothetical protein [Stieleria varia]|uniref:Uncharacterized protein n=1 Tax=Stieleria varia TaxID=2528005 RepID=A0A5C6B1K6_9BACT|nr:hypothetical protein [Stieleria varia]TWU04314.1 hypothetical protein Pla52n_23540 [Stieleria varia]